MADETSQTPTTASPQAVREAQADNALNPAHAALLAASYRHWTGRELVDAGLDPQARARVLFEAPFVVASHGTEPDPIFNYGNQAVVFREWEYL